MFSRKTRKLDVVILMLIAAVLFSFCIINKCKAVDVNANVIEVNVLNIVYAEHYVYEAYPNEVFPALPLEAELYYNRKPTGQMVALTWATDGIVWENGPDRAYIYTYMFTMPAGYEWIGDSNFSVQVPIIEDKRPTVASLNDCTVNVPQNQKYTLPETLKGMVAGESGLVDVAVKWDNVADTSQIGTKIYTATAVNSYNYKIPYGTTITAELTLTVGNEESPIGFKHHYKPEEKFQTMKKDGYTFLGWAKADDASSGVFEAGTVVELEGDYFAILAKLEYLGVSFRIYKQGVRFGFVLKVYGLNSEQTTDKLDVEYVDQLIAKILEKVTFIATIYEQQYEYPYTNTELKYGYIEKYKGYVSNLVFEEISNNQFDLPIKVDAKFEIGSKTLSKEGATCTIREKAQDAYDKRRFDVTDQATIDKMVQMYGVNANKG